MGGRPSSSPVARDRRRLEPDERRGQILAVARRSFGEKSYSEVSLAEVAAAAGVARGLINHYFGGKRELYLEVLRSMVAVPDMAVETLPRGSLAERADAVIDRFLTVVHRHRGIWLTTVAMMSPSRDDDVAQVTFEAEERTVDLVLLALGVDASLHRRDDVRAVIRAYGAMVRATSYEWLARGSLSRTQAHELLSSMLLLLAGHIEDIVGARPGGVSAFADGDATPRG
jgi:AcrR family transcriptional regulator